MRTFILTIFVVTGFFTKAQTPIMETVGIPTSSVPVNSYTGWSNTNTNIVSYSGSAEVQNQQPCTIPVSSAGGNILLTNTVGTFFSVTYTITVPPLASVGIDFAMRNYDASSPNEMVLMMSTTNGMTWVNLAYQPFAGNIFLNGDWNYMTSGSVIGFPNSSTPATITFRFQQASSAKQFRLDDINLRITVPLSINLTSFSSNTSSNDVTLNWTANSTNPANSFILERSTNAMNFSAINTQTAKGSGTYNYNYTDAISVANSKVFYRLQMKDVSGKITYSNILAVNTGKKKSGLIESLYPSPARKSTTVALKATANGIASIEIFDAVGSKVKTQTYSIVQGLNSILIDVSMLKAGTYILKASTKELTQSVNLVVVR